MPGWVFKRYAHELAAPLAAVFNRCVHDKYFPDLWKLANVNPLKKGRYSFRPISLLPCASKILENIFIKKCLVPHLHSAFNKFPFGFLPTGFGGCCNAVTYARLDILKHLNFHGGYVRWLQIDIKKAFDQASHSVIISLLQKYFQNFPSILAFIRSFLSNRWQRVLSTSGECSSWSPVTSGVPQGSVLGPILFAIMMNDFPSLSSSSKMIVYANDIVLLHHVPPNKSDNLQVDLSVVLKWISNLKFNVNVDKFCSITFSRSAVLPPPLLSNGIILPEVSSKVLNFSVLSYKATWNIPSMQLLSILKQVVICTSLNFCGSTKLPMKLSGRLIFLLFLAFLVIAGLQFVICNSSFSAYFVHWKREPLSGQAFHSLKPFFVPAWMAFARG